MKLILLFLSIAVIALSIERRRGDKLVSSQLKEAIPQELKHFSFGYREAISDLLWIQFIQSFDICGDREKCRTYRWPRSVLELIAAQTPHFRRPMAVGPMIVSFINEDLEGATKLFEVAVKNFPNDWAIAYRAGYHMLFEAGNKVRAAELFEQAARNGAPPWLYSLASRVYTEAGKQELARQLVFEMQNSGVPKDIIERIEKKLGEK